MARWTATAIFSLAAVAVSGQADERTVESIRHEAARLAEQGEGMTIPGHDGWLFLRAELRHLGAGKFWGNRAAAVSRATRPDHADPLPAIVDFKNQLEAMGIELLIVAVPPKAAIYPERIFGFPPGDTVHQQFYALLRENGVEVLDLTSDFLAARNQPPGPVFCRTDTHWSGIGAVKAAQYVEEHLTGRPWLRQHRREHPSQFRQRWEQRTIEGDLLRALPEPKPEHEKLMLRFIETADGALPQPSRESPVILMGDSHTLVFHAGGDMHARGAGLADQLAYELGFPVDLHGVRGSGATPARINLGRAARTDPDYLARKRLVIWCFSAREFTESDGWQPIPIAPPRH